MRRDQRPWWSGLAIATIILAQLWHWGGWMTDATTRSYWLITYQFGFVRRGLLGELLRHLPAPLFPSWTAILASALAVGLIPALAVLVLAGRLLKDGGTGATILGLALLSTPAGIDMLVSVRRPDQLGLALLIATALVLTRARSSVVALVLLGAGWTTLALIHEGGCLAYGSFVIPLVWWSRRGRSRWTTGAALLGPMAVALGAVLSLGRATTGIRDQLFDYGAPYAAPVTSIAKYLTEGVSESLVLVGRMPAANRIPMLIAGLGILGVTAVILAAAGVSIALKGALPLAPVVLAYLVLFATGVDWGRWFAALSMSLLVAGAAILLRRTPHQAAPATIRWWWLALAFLVALIAPYPGFIGPEFI